MLRYYLGKLRFFFSVNRSVHSVVQHQTAKNTQISLEAIYQLSTAISHCRERTMLESARRSQLQQPSQPRVTSPGQRCPRQPEGWVPTAYTLLSSQWGHSSNGTDTSSQTFLKEEVKANKPESSSKRLSKYRNLEHRTNTEHDRNLHIWSQNSSHGKLTLSVAKVRRSKPSASDISRDSHFCAPLKRALSFGVSPTSIIFAPAKSCMMSPEVTMGEMPSSINVPDRHRKSKERK